MANGISFIHVIVTEELKKEYNVALAKAGLTMKQHIMNSVEELINGKEKKKK